jgi:hypothetical protein
MTPQIAQSIATALDTRIFKEAHRSTPVLNAQDALTGITHYCDAGTLRFHHSRIVGASVVSCGAFFKVTETCAQDYQNTRRGYRVVLFDMTGSAVYRPSLDELTRTREQADKAFYSWFDQFDELAHYRDKINHKADKLARQIAVLNEVGRALAAEQDAEVAA